MRTKSEHRQGAPMGQPEKCGPEPVAFDLNAAVTDAIGACDGDLLATVRSLVVANNFLLAQNQVLAEELDEVWRWVSPGYTRSTNKRRMKSGESE
jgi:hypothetical protein